MSKLESLIPLFEEKHYMLNMGAGKLAKQFKTTKEVKTFLDDFLTKIESTTLAKRLMIALFLEKGKSYEFIKNNLKVSSATIANVDKMMTTGSHGFSLALKKIEADEWASKTAKRIASLFKKK